ncbi:TPA: hypothetical protein MYL57_004517 [Klebsiella variicola subsp. variicola]|uniref:hypothetical protein n=1 Tax=Klebsiella variicola TaxID=244366 RepID=UPI00190F01AA|nr:hypothetical protein [Klebsiella variicola]HCB0644459.1 hypothetical protein [Klebsiella variicola subsp. variicola]
MTITLQAVNELIASLESAGELSIREQKFLKLAKAFKQLAAENVTLKSKGKELLGEACAVYSRLNKLIDPSIGDFVDGQTLHEFQFVLDAETPASDRMVAGIKADAIDEAAVELDRVDTVASTRVIGFKLREFAKQLREGDGK